MAIRPLTVMPVGATLLAGRFAPGERFATWRIHGTDDWELMATTAGRGRIGWKGGELVVEQGEIVVLRPGTLHDYGTHPEARGWENVWVHFRPDDDWLDLLDWPERAPGILHLHPDATLFAPILLALEEVVQHSQAGHRRVGLTRNALERALLWCAEAAAGAGSGGLDLRLRAALEALDGDLARPFAVDQLARLAGLSSSRFAHLFRERLGVPVARYREQQRLRRACQLLAGTSRSIKAIAAEVGFPDQLHFSHRFRRFTGSSPKAWRIAQSPSPR